MSVTLVQPPEKLSAKRVRFTLLLSRLIAFANMRGMNVALNEVMRSKAQAALNAQTGAGISNSVHTLGLAADLLLYTPEGEYITDSAAYRELGEYWRGSAPDARWGGDFKDSAGNPKPDGGHFSLEHNGVK